MNLIASGFWDVVATMGQSAALTVVILVVVFYFWTKKPNPSGTNGAYSDGERKAEERGEIRVRLQNLEAMKGIMDDNQKLILQFARDNLKLTNLFMDEVSFLKDRVKKLEQIMK